MTAAVAMSIELLSRTRFGVPNPGVVYLVAVVSSIYIGGMAAGFVSASDRARPRAGLLLVSRAAASHYGGEDLETS